MASTYCLKVLHSAFFCPGLASLAITAQPHGSRTVGIRRHPLAVYEKLVENLNTLLEVPGGYLFHLGRSLPVKFRSEAPSPDDCVFTEFLPHSVEGLVDLALGGGCGTEEVGLAGRSGRSDRAQIVDTDADQAEGPAVCLAGKEGPGGPDHILRRLCGVPQGLE